MQPNSRREREKQRKRREILEAAMTVFGRKGFHGTTMAEICQASEYPLGTIYKFFPGKEHIYHDLVVEKGHELGQLLLDIFKRKELSPAERLQECLLANADFFNQNKDFIRIYISERNNIDAILVPNLNRNINRMHEKMITLYSDLFQEGVATKEFKPLPSEELAILFSGLIQTTAWFCLTARDGRLLKEKFHTAFEVFTRGIYTKKKIS